MRHHDSAATSDPNPSSGPASTATPLHSAFGLRLTASLVPGLLVLLTGCDVPQQAPAGEASYDPRTAEAQVRADPNGWTRLVPSADTRHVYVSASSGNDNQSGLDEQNPKRTIQAAMLLLRPAHPDWLHVKCGDTFSGGLPDWYLSGRSANEPMVVTTYGASLDRPRFHCGTGFGLSVHGTTIHDVAFVGLHFVADTYNGGNGQPYGVSLLQPCTRVLIEDCAIERFFTNLRFQGNHQALKLRRSMIADAYTTGTSHAQGIYVEGVDDCLIEECLFDHNGWLTSVPGANATIFRHNIYIQGNTSNVTLRGNIVARAGSHGLQARSGGVVRDNLFLGNSINMLVGNNIANNGSVTATVVGNVMLDGKNISGAEPRGWSAQFQCFGSGEIAFNVAAHQQTGAAPRGIEFDSTLGVGLNNVSFHDNVAYKWGAPTLLIGNRFSGFSMTGNDLQEYANTELLRTAYGGSLAGLSSSGNRMFSATATGSWMFYANQYMSLATWKSMVSDVTSTAAQVSYPRPEFRIGDYDLATGGAGSLDSFLTRARAQSRRNWRETLIGTNVARFFRSNFGLAY